MTVQQENQRRGERERGFARVEFLAQKPEIEQELKAGYTRMAIYKRLKGNGKISMSYKHFCDLVNGKRKYRKKDPQREERGGDTGSAVTAPARPQSAGRARPPLPVYTGPAAQADGGGFPHDKTTDLESMVYGGKEKGAA